MDQELDIRIVIEQFKDRVAQLEYELIIANALLKQKIKELEEAKTHE